MSFHSQFSTLNSQLIIAAALLLSSCIREHGAAMADVDPRGWSTPASVVFENTDSLSRRAISVVVRHQPGRAPRSLALDIQTLTPDSLTLRERVVLPLSASDQPLPYRIDAVLGRTGNYIFTLTPEANTQGISAIGIEITDR